MLKCAAPALTAVEALVSLCAPPATTRLKARHRHQMFGGDRSFISNASANNVDYALSLEDVVTSSLVLFVVYRRDIIKSGTFLTAILPHLRW